MGRWKIWLAEAISIRIYSSREGEDASYSFLRAFLLFYANLISNLQRRYLREIISKVCFFRGIYFPFSLSPLPSWNSSPPVNSFSSSSSSFLWSLNAARLNIPYFHSFVRWKCAFLVLPRTFERKRLLFDVYNFTISKKGGKEGFIYVFRKKTSGGIHRPELKIPGIKLLYY